MPDDEKLTQWVLTDGDLARLQPLIGSESNAEAVWAIWKEIGEREGFYPTTVEWAGPPDVYFRARALDRYTSIKDIEDGWDFNDWIDGWGGGENWRIQLNRRLNDLERKRIIPRLQGYRESGPTLDHMVVFSTTLCEPDLEMIKCRVQRVEAIEIKDKWLPIFPPPADITITMPGDGR